MLMTQDIIGEPELTGGKHVIFVAIILKGTGFTDQGIDNMTVIDVMTVFTT